MPYGRKFPYGRSLSPACSSISLSRSSTPCWCPPRGGFRRWRTPARNTIPADGSTRARLVGPPPAGRAVPDSRRPGVSAPDDSRSVRIPVPPLSAPARRYRRRHPRPRRRSPVWEGSESTGPARADNDSGAPSCFHGPRETYDRIRRNAAVASLHDRPPSPFPLLPASPWISRMSLYGLSPPSQPRRLPTPGVIRQSVLSDRELRQRRVALLRDGLAGGGSTAALPGTVAVRFRLPGSDLRHGHPLLLSDWLRSRMTNLGPTPGASTTTRSARLAEPASFVPDGAGRRVNDGGRAGSGSRFAPRPRDRI